MKTCNKCNQHKPLSEFYKDKWTKDGYSYPCKTCDNKRRKSVYHSNVEHTRERVKKWRHKNAKELNIFYWNKCGLRHRVSGKYLLDTFLRQKKLCFYCKTELQHLNVQVEHLTPKDNTKLAISCCDCNRLKWQRSEKDFRLFIKEYINRFK